MMITDSPPSTLEIVFSVIIGASFMISLSLFIYRKITGR